MLYVVGASESSISALYAVPVTRDPATQDIVDIGPASAVVKVFSGNATTAGLDAGFEFGPAGTLFYTYWSSNRLGERPGGVGGAETQFNMANVGVPSSIAGLTFSPHRTDPGTGFGRMQISSWQGANLYEVPLTPAAGGIFTPGQAILFVTLPQQGTGGIQYVPSGPLAGNLMYVNWNFGEVRILAIDPTTGLPIDKTTGVPTAAPQSKDSRFAYDFGVGPWGLEFDPRTNDFFVGTWGGTPYDTIHQIGGFPVPTRRPPRPQHCRPPLRSALRPRPHGHRDRDEDGDPAATVTAARTATPLPTRDARRARRLHVLQGAGRQRNGAAVVFDVRSRRRVRHGDRDPRQTAAVLRTDLAEQPSDRRPDRESPLLKIQPPKQPKFAGRKRRRRE
jgi:hypothetical protein